MSYLDYISNKKKSVSNRHFEYVNNGNCRSNKHLIGDFNKTHRVCDYEIKNNKFEHRGLEFDKNEFNSQLHKSQETPEEYLPDINLQGSAISFGYCNMPNVNFCVDNFAAGCESDFSLC